MGTPRTVLIACSVGVLFFGACSSDAKKTSPTVTSSTGDIATATSSTADVASVTTATTGVTTATSLTPTTPTSPATGATTVTTAPTSSATTTTVKARVVTSPSDNVKLGDSGDGVKQIQTALKNAGYKVVVDGDFGKQTDTAVKAFQKKNGLKQDGVVGPKTWSKLSAAKATSTTTKGTTTTVAATTTTKA